MTRETTYYITTSIAYTNAPPHIGYAYEVVLSDILARYARDRGRDTFFLTGTDEHGTKIARSAEHAGKDPQVFVDELSSQFRELGEALFVSPDDFIRTSDRTRHWPGAQAMWRKLAERGDIYKDTYVGYYCVGCEAFVQERELVEGKCPTHDTKPERVEEENYFFRLSRYTDAIRKAIEDKALTIVPEERANEMIAMLSEGLSDVSFSRPRGSVSWGVPVPDDESQMMYVWCDALSNYISALGFGSDDETRFDTYWPAHVHVIGKDILRFHALIWPAMLMSAGLSLPKNLLVHGFITSGGKKMSKSLGNVIDPFALIESYGTEAVRYYFAREIVPTEDGDFTEERFTEVYNANLANGLGNLVSRTLKMASQYFDGQLTRNAEIDVPVKHTIQTPFVDMTQEGHTVPYAVENDVLPRFHRFMEEYRVNEAADVIWELMGALDGYITDYEPFKLIKEDREKTENILWHLCYGLFVTSQMLRPFMPETAQKVQEALGTTQDESGMPETFSVTPLEAPLFARITE